MVVRKWLCPGRVAMVQVVGLDSAATKARISAPSVSGSSLTPRSSTDWLQHRDAGIDQPGAGRAGAGGELARVVGVQRDVDRLADGERAHQGGADRSGSATGMRVWSGHLHVRIAAIAARARRAGARRARTGRRR